MAANLDAPLASGEEALVHAADYLERCWKLVPELDEAGIEELTETASLIAADLFEQQRSRSG